MSLEKKLVFELRDEGNTSSDVLQIVADMTDPNGKGRAVVTDPKKIKAALSQYDAKNLLKKRKEYKRYNELFRYFLIPAFVILAAELILGYTIFLKIP